MARNVPPELEDKFRSCKDEVMAQGQSEESAYGICYVSVVEGKSRDDVLADFKLNPDPFKAIGADVKAGARNNQPDRDRIRMIRKASQEIHNITMEMEPR